MPNLYGRFCGQTSEKLNWINELPLNFAELKQSIGKSALAFGRISLTFLVGNT